MSDAEQNSVEQPAEIPALRYTAPTEREKMVPLEHPFELNGTHWTQIRVRRVTGKQVSDYMDRMRAGDRDAMPPMVDCPQEVWDALDDDDQMLVDEAARPFTPRRLKAAVELIQQLGEESSG